MTNRIEVGFKKGIRDALGEKTKKRIADNLGLPVASVATVEVYTVAGELSAAELRQSAEGPLSDPVIQEYAINKPLAKNFDWLIEVGFRPGVTDNVGKTAREAITLLLGTSLGDRKINVYTSRQYLISGPITKADAENIASGLLANDLIERHQVVGRAEFDFVNGMPAHIPQVTGRDEPQVAKINLTRLDAAALLKISQEKLLALNLEEMQAIAAHFADPAVVKARRKFGLDENTTDVELECLAQTWSEHCKHKIFNSRIDYFDGRTKKTINSLFKTYIKGSTAKIRKAKGRKDFCLSVFVDNAGVIKFNKEHNLVFKVETHNSPSALDPYGGALTGIVGVNRDPFGTGLGAKLIFNTDVFCFASPFHRKKLPPRILHPRRIYEGVREGVEHGGNKSGIPTVNGSIVFDERYLGKPLVYCGTAGIMPARLNGKPTHTKEIQPGDVIIMTGGRIGKDGIHGATFSSEELHEGSPVTAVQIGDPITQKKMTDFLLKARDRGLYRALTDNGAGGLSSSIGEMAAYSGGCEIDLSLAPLKYAGLQPWEILVSEAQERMSLAVDPKKVGKFLELARKMGVEATVLGRFTKSGIFHVRYGEKTVACLDMDFLHDGVPQMKLSARWKAPKHAEPVFAAPANLGKALSQMLSRLNICSKESVVRQYDHEVQGGSVLKPLVGVVNDGPADACITRPRLESHRAVILANGLNPKYGLIDPYWMAASAIDEALRNIIAVGGRLERCALLDNFCWGNTDKPDRLGGLLRAAQACYDMAKVLGTPFISGKDSLNNEYKTETGESIAIPPTLLISAIAVMEDCRTAVSMDLKRPGDSLFIVGETRKELGGSHYYEAIGHSSGVVPQVDPARARTLFNALADAIAAGLVRACHDCSEGGLGVALAEMAFAGGCGAEVTLCDLPRSTDLLRSDWALFSESNSRFIVEVIPGKEEEFRARFMQLPCARIGEVTSGPRLRIRGLTGELVVDEAIDLLKNSWQETMRW